MPEVLEKVQQILPPIPNPPNKPVKPMPEPQPFNTGWLIAISIIGTFISLLNQSVSLLIFTISLAFIIGAFQYYSYPTRKNDYFNQIRNYEQEDKKYQIEMIDYNQSIKIIRSDENIKKYRESILKNPTLINTGKPDQIKNDVTRGVGETRFEPYIKKYFVGKIYTKKSFTIEDFSYPYTPDFCYIDDKLCIDIEIDEPYFKKQSNGLYYPYHEYDSYKECQRNQFFIDLNWIVIRFAEEQVIRYPEQCCKEIAKVIFNITYQAIPDSLVKIPDLEPIPRWTKSQAKEMIASKYRDTYL
ncbi:hypothetical protein [Anabaena azotica]|uniref:DUF559 domain-containing protein n=1 Tax=Anabaena azotica FACHB-119 TaxID=947527 RepID=A0ABR8DDH6_9NOST|nr:hypothetical protein [Anabaena azotica]MBD2505290.1 hypothetical protein [Anabaena azotica FACHB-119]